MKIFLVKLLFYMGRWQISTFVMTPVILLAKYLGIIETWEQVALANLVCAPPFYFLDRFIIVILDRWLRKLLEE